MNTPFMVFISREGNVASNARCKRFVEDAAPAKLMMVTF
jgi:hypothetical protein